jgi:hypothetical protein
MMPYEKFVEDVGKAICDANEYDWDWAFNGSFLIREDCCRDARIAMAMILDRLGTVLSTESTRTTIAEEIHEGRIGRSSDEIAARVIAKLVAALESAQAEKDGK